MRIAVLIAMMVCIALAGSFIFDAWYGGIPELQSTQISGAVIFTAASVMLSFFVRRRRA